eukprot:5811997-Alexandrium_andersonii.AAC.1
MCIRDSLRPVVARRARASFGRARGRATQPGPAADARCALGSASGRPSALTWPTRPRRPLRRAST